MHKTEKTAKESRMNLMYNHLCDRTLAYLGFVPEKLDRIPGLVLSIKSRLPSNVGRSL